jgi:hypothetical protein
MGLLDIENKLDSICDYIKRENIPIDVHNLIKRPYYPKERDERDQFIMKLGRIKEKLSGEPEPKDIAEIWKEDQVTPRNLISLLALYSEDINRNALLIALGYHKNILDRFNSGIRQDRFNG